NGAISVSKDNMCYFNVFPCDGIFELNMHNHISNERSIYTCSNKKTKHNLDSAFLWHCRLGHVNKKRIEKLQHDGLLKSIDDESFDVYVSCISGKMARKPLTHASERVDDLLVIIHSDVCGPFRTTSRECANYYVTFIDDFGRYGYVYLIKHKHEVFEMFKTFQNEVENQLGKTIKALRSDRGGEYLSQEFLDHLRRYPKETMGYYFYYPLKNKIFVARYAEFFETNLIKQEASRSTVDFDEIQSEDAQPSENTSLHQHEEHKLGDHGEPPNYRAALSDPESEKWLKAMNAEVQSMKDNQVWNLVDLPPNCKTVGSKWLFKKKTDMDGNIHTYKARLVAKGFTQTYGVDYEETFSSIADINAIRILIAIAAYYDYKIWQMDVKTAFLNGRLNKDVYMMDTSKRGTIPMQPNVDLSNTQGPSTPAEVKRMKGIPYASAVGSIMYGVRNTKDMFLVYGGDSTTKLGVTCYTDASWETDRDNLRSQMGFVFMMNGGAVDWKSSKQSTTAMSSIEAKYIAATETAMEAIWIRKFISWLGVVPNIERPMDMYCDNTGSITIADELGVQRGTKHFQQKYHFIREAIQEGDIRILKVHTDDNLADSFTKPMPYTKHVQHARTIRLIPVAPIETTNKVILIKEKLKAAKDCQKSYVMNQVVTQLKVFDEFPRGRARFMKEDHEQHLKSILELLKGQKYYVKFTKCEFWLQEVDLLGHVVNEKRIHVDPAIVEAVKKWLALRNPIEIHKFLGLAGCYKRFIENFLKIAKPLMKLTKKAKEFTSGEEREEAFQTLKHTLCNTPTLAIPEGTENFVVYYDASHHGLGCVLMQRDKIGIRAIVYRDVGYSISEDLEEEPMEEEPLEEPKEEVLKLVLQLGSSLSLLVLELL
ncbi:retrotransposon protein, putative, ty1-copia subclass, partial [Tanacetum coccineum]